MGLKLKLEVKNAFLGSHQAPEVVAAAANVDATAVAVDVSACCRSVVAAIEHQSSGHTVTASRIAYRFFTKYTGPHPEANIFYFAFDSYSDMHPLRFKMYDESRYAPATATRLANLKPGEVAVGSRVYRHESRPYTRDEVDAWGLHTEIDARRVFSGSPGKTRLYQLMFDEMTRLSAEQTGLRGPRTMVFDGIGSYDDPNGVVTVELNGKDRGFPPKLTAAPRKGKHGEADQKLANFFATMASKGEGAVWYTIDGDAIGQCVCLGLRPRIVFSKNQVVDPAKLPQGASTALALLSDGGDYNDSFVYAGIYSETLLGAEPAADLVKLQPDGTVTIDTTRLFRFLGTEPGTQRRKRTVFSVEGEPPAKFYRTQAKAREAAEAHGGVAVKKSGATGHMVVQSIGDLVRSVVYWLHAGTANSSDFGMMGGLYTSLAGSLGDLGREVTAETLRGMNLDPLHIKPT